MKKFARWKMLWSVLFSLMLVFSFTLAACGEGTPKPNPPTHTAHVDADGDGKCDECGAEVQKPNPPTHTTHVDADGDGKCDECGAEVQKPNPPEESFSVEYRAGFTPTKFQSVTNEITELADGVHLVANKMALANGDLCVVYTVEIDLEKANVVAGTKGNRTLGYAWEKDTPYAMAQAWEEETGGQVYASVNADFFGAQCVNAFVKDGVILKDSHNDNSSYDYKNDGADVPASAPMLFGVKGTEAQIKPIVSYEGDVTSAAVKQQLVQAKLSYEIVSGGKTYAVSPDAAPSDQFLSLRMTGKVSQRDGYAVKLDCTNGFSQMKVLEVVAAKRTEIEAGEGYVWLQATGSLNDYAKYLGSLGEGDVVSLSVASPDGTWNGYETVLGCRQALVKDGAIADTVALENSNGAQKTDVPRTAVGIKKDGTVVLFAVESMYYYQRAKEGDPHGMNLPELAEFIYFYGCDEAANFDGGGSTQLVVRGEEEREGRVVVRSADTAGEGLYDTRPVMNAFLVTSRGKRDAANK